MAQNLLSRRKALQLFSGAPLLPLGSVVSASSLLAACGGGDDDNTTPPVTKNYVSATFTSMAAPTLSTPANMATMYAASQLKVAFDDKSEQVYDLGYQPFFVTGDMVSDGKGGQVLAGGYYDINNNKIIDKTVAGKERHFFSDSPDGTSLLTVPDAKVDGVKGKPVFAVVQFEYTTWAQDGKTDMYGKLPSPIAVLTLDQDQTTGKLSLVKYHNVDTSKVTACGSPAAPACRPGAPTCPKSTSPMPSASPTPCSRPSARTCMATSQGQPLPLRPHARSDRQCRRHGHHQEALLHGPHLARAGAGHARPAHRADG
jgi:hypothetical protein